MEFNDNIPVKGKVYNFYDDGKVSYIRQHKCLITDVIPSNKFGKRDKGSLIYFVYRYYWIFADETDYYVFGKVQGDINEDQLFARTKEGDWYSVGIEYYGKEKQFDIKDNSLVGGLLDVTGEFTKELESDNGEENNTKVG